MGSGQPAPPGRAPPPAATTTPAPASQVRGGPGRQIHVRLNLNLKVRTCAELVQQKKLAHLSGFDQLLAELGRDLRELARGPAAARRMLGDPDARGAMDHFVRGIVEDVHKVAAAHRELDARAYLDPDEYRSLVRLDCSYGSEFCGGPGMPVNSSRQDVGFIVLCVCGGMSHEWTDGIREEEADGREGLGGGGGEGGSCAGQSRIALFSFKKVDPAVLKTAG